LAQGGGAKKKMTKVTYICRSAKKKAAAVTYLLYFIFIFIFIFIFYRFFFVTRGVKTTKKKSEKIHLGSFSSVFFFLPSVVLADFF
jgi:hypothetical protein